MKEIKALASKRFWLNYNTSQLHPHGNWVVKKRSKARISPVVRGEEGSRQGHYRHEARCSHLISLENHYLLPSREKSFIQWHSSNKDNPLGTTIISGQLRNHSSSEGSVLDIFYRFYNIPASRIPCASIAPNFAITSSCLSLITLEYNWRNWLTWKIDGVINRLRNKTNIDRNIHLETSITWICHGFSNKHTHFS